MRLRFMDDLLVRGFHGGRVPVSPGCWCKYLITDHGLRTMHAPIIIVSGLPRSGTSLMMQMLDKGGIEVVSDNIRTPDTDNPRGYYELEQVKQIKHDASWLPGAR